MWAGYEIELKSDLTPEKYMQLLTELHQELPRVNEEIIHTTRYRLIDERTGHKRFDIRTRHSEKTFELVVKGGDSTSLCRREVRTPLNSLDHVLITDAQLLGQGYRPDRPWTKHKVEFAYVLGGYTYTLCLQDIVDYKKILEVEFLSQTDTSAIHGPNLHEILAIFGCEPIEPAAFLESINAFRGTE